MKKYNIIFVIFLVTNFYNTSFAQFDNNSDYIQISENKSDMSDSQIIEAISKANMENYRLRYKSNLIQFDDGFLCTLLPAITLLNNGEDIDLENYLDQYPKDYNMPKFSIGKNDMIVIRYEKSIK